MNCSRTSRPSLCHASEERDRARVARGGVVSAPSLLQELTSSTDDRLAEQQRVAPLQPLGPRAHTSALSRRETALAPSAPRARRLPASTDSTAAAVPHATYGVPDTLGVANTDNSATQEQFASDPFSRLTLECAPIVTFRCQAPRLHEWARRIHSGADYIPIKYVQYTLSSSEACASH